VENGAIELVPGARAAEARLFELLRALAAEARGNPRLLARPVRVVVPSRSLRLHVCERIAAELGATAGVAVQTLHALALEVLGRAGERDGGGDALVDLLARRAARAEGALREACEPFQDGYRAVVGTLHDLLDAGLTPDLCEPLAEALAGARLSQADLGRAQAVLRVAGVVARELGARGAAGRPYALERAQALLRDGGQRHLPTRELLVHGFADLTGRAADLVERLLVCLGGTILIDHPPDPANPAEEARGCAFTARLRLRLAGLAHPVSQPAAAAAPRVVCFRAPGAEAEVREVGRRLRELLRGGARPERCALVARDLGPYRAALRTHFGRLGLPFSGLRVQGPRDGPGRRLAALALLLEQRGATPTDRWLDLLRYFAAGGDGRRRRRRAGGELRLGLRLAGGALLEQLAAMELVEGSSEWITLPLCRGVGRATPREGDTGPGRFEVQRALLARSEVLLVQRRAAAALVRFARWEERAPLERHLMHFERLRLRDLGWRITDAEEQRLRAALADVSGDLAGEDLELGEFQRAVAVAVHAAGGPALGGSGGGVQILEVMEARARTFDHLFVLGLQRDTFPRPVREDPLLGDAARTALEGLLPEISIKGRGFDEERYLFAELVSSSPEVTLSWQVADDDGRPRVVSPLLVRLLGEGGDERVETVSGVRDPEAPGPRTAHEAALRGGLARRTEGHRERLAAALAEGGRDPSLADVRARLLEAFEEGPFEPLRLAPWLGNIGAERLGELRPDISREPTYVTRLESLARCPWQGLLTRYLGLGSVHDPLESLPTVEKRVMGMVVHRVLEELACRAGVPRGGRLAEVLARGGWTVPWPEPQAFEALLASAARAELEKERAPLAGHVRLVAECARELLLRAREFLEKDGHRFADARVLGVEVEGRAEVPLALGRLAIDFRADRVERREGHAVLSDFKTGWAEKKADAFGDELAAGLALQPAAYALAAGDGGVGRYLYLQAPLDEVEVGPGVGLGPHRGPLQRALQVLVDAWSAGTLFPRVVEPYKEKEPIWCKSCEVAVACLRGDSGARRALQALAAEGSGAPATLGALFRLHPDQPGAGA
jgi:hypothetical protein